MATDAGGMPAVLRSARGRLTALIAGAAVLASALVGAPLLGLTPSSSAAAFTGGDFMPGLIIADQVFYDSSAMSEAQIQQFLAGKGSGLAGYTFSVGSRGATYSPAGRLRCGAFQGGTLAASTIIYRAQVACGISAKVLLVTLQKEQGLITRSAPSQAALDRAMGYACPDTAPCAPTTLGFGNQVYSAALQFITYKVNGFARQPGWNAIAYNPNAGCGANTIYLQNYATAALYNYTPYQPDYAALANLTGTGDSCSSYGNRNFWVYFQSWFGSTLGPYPYPVSGPSIAGNTTVSTTVTAVPGPWGGAPSFSYSWLSCTSSPAAILDTVPSGCTALPAATSVSYVSTAQDVGKYLAVMVTGSNSSGSMTSGSAMTAKVGTPANTTAPTVSGSTTVGSTWTVNTGTWTGTPAPSIVIYWLRCARPIASVYTTVPAGCAAISGANATSYVSTSADVGSYLTAQLAGSNALGFSLAGAASTTAMGFPANSVAPTVSGSALIGSTWTLNIGTWTGSPAPTFVIFWLRCAQPVTAGFASVPAGCAAIAGANGNTYVSTSADVGKYLTAQVGGTGPQGFALAGAVNTVAVQAVPLATPANTVPPTVAGLPAVGSTWTVNTGTWTGTPTPTIIIYWLRCTQPLTATYSVVPAGCAAVKGANGASYVSTSSDVGKYLTAQVAGNSTLGFALAGATNSTAIQSSVAPSVTPENVALPTVSGSASVGSTWSADTGAWSGSPSPTIVLYWLRCSQAVTAGFTTVPTTCSAIPGATATSYVSTSADLGKYVTVQIGAVNSVGFSLAGALNGVAVQAAIPAVPSNVVAPTVSGSPTVGATWTLHTGTWNGYPTPTMVIYWLRCSQPVATAFGTVPTGCVAISGANSASYVASASDLGKYLTAQVGGTNSLGFGLAGAVNTTAIQAG